MSRTRTFAPSRRARDADPDRALVGVETEGAVAGELRRQPRDEAGPVAQRGRRPPALGDRRGAGEGHALDVALGRHMLGPQVRLQPENVTAVGIGERDLRRARGQRRIAGVVGVDVGERHDRAAPRRFGGQRALAVVEIQRWGGRHDDVVTGLRRRDRAIGPVPRQDGGVGRQPGIDDLVPADQPPAAGSEEGTDPADDIRLQGGFVGEAERAHPRLRRRVGVPRDP